MKIVYPLLILNLQKKDVLCLLNREILSIIYKIHIATILE